VIVFAVSATLGRHPVVPALAGPAGDVQTTVLVNGLTVATRQRPSAETVSVAVAVRAGGRDEAESLRGGSHLLEHLHFLGTARYPTTEALTGAVSAVGGNLNAATSTETTTYYATVPADRLGVAVDVLAEMMQRASFPAEAAERERGVVQDELRGGRPTGLSIGLASLGTALLGPLGQDAGGSVDGVGAIDVDALLAYRARRYTARNMVVGVVGPVEHRQVVSLAERAFTALPSGEALSPTPLPDPASGQRLTGESPYESVVLAGQRIPGLDSPDAAALLVLDGILDTPGTRMADAFEPVDFALAGGTRIQRFSDAGLWTGYAIAPPAAADEVAEVIREQIRRLQDEPLSEGEVAAATRYLSGSTLLAAERTEQQARHLATGLLLGIYETEESQAARIRAVTPAEVQRVARAYLDPDSFSILAQR
jgi:predicted Zn-dependent peptidase